MPNKSHIFKILGIIIVSLVAILIAINILYIKEAFSNKQCTIVNVLTIILLLWAIAFLFVVLKYSKEDKKIKK